MMSIPAATTTACSLCASRWRHSVKVALPLVPSPPRIAPSQLRLVE